MGALLLPEERSIATSSSGGDDIYCLQPRKKRGTTDRCGR